MVTALEPLPEALFDQILCLLVVAGIIAWFLIGQWRDRGDS